MVVALTSGQGHESDSAEPEGGTLGDSREMLGWELRVHVLRLRVTKENKISKSSQMRNKEISREKSRAFFYKNNTDLAR